MADNTYYALRVWHEDLDKLRSEIEQFDDTHTDSILAHLRTVPDGATVLVMDFDEHDDHLGFGGLTLEAFNHAYEWRDRDDTRGLFTKAHLK